MGKSMGKRRKYKTDRGLISLLVLLAPSAAIAGSLAVAGAEVISGDNVRIGFRGGIAPRALPRRVLAPVSLRVEGTVSPIGSQTPSGLARVVVEVNRHAVFSTAGLPRCSPRELGGTDSREALALCGDALVGSGYITSHIDYPDQAPFPARGRVLVFNSRKNGRQSLVVHVFGHRPASISTLLSGALVANRPPRGAFGPRVVIEMPKVRDGWGYVNGFGLTFHRRYGYRGRERSLISASCPAPKGLRVVPFRSARGSFELSDGQVLSRALGGSCRASG